MRHQKVGCGGELYHREDMVKDWYQCSACGVTWTKRKRRACPMGLTAEECAKPHRACRWCIQDGRKSRD